MRIEFEEQGDGDVLCRVPLTVYLSPDKDPDEVVVIFRVYRPESFSVFLPGKSPYVFIGPLSCTRVSTRENVHLDATMMDHAVKTMVEAATEYFSADDYIGMK